jgi:hypothetical protein
MATRAETFRSEQARQRAHDAAAPRDDESPGEEDAGTGAPGARRPEQRAKEAIPQTVTQMHKTFAPSARHLKRT